MACEKKTKLDKFNDFLLLIDSFLGKFSTVSGVKLIDKNFISLAYFGKKSFNKIDGNFFCFSFGNHKILIEIMSSHLIICYFIV